MIAKSWRHRARTDYRRWRRVPFSALRDRVRADSRLVGTLILPIHHYASAAAASAARRTTGDNRLSHCSRNSNSCNNNEAALCESQSAAGKAATVPSSSPSSTTVVAQVRIDVYGNKAAAAPLQAEFSGEFERFFFPFSTTSGTSSSSSSSNGRNGDGSSNAGSASDAQEELLRRRRSLSPDSSRISTPLSSSGAVPPSCPSFSSLPLLFHHSLYVHAGAPRTANSSHDNDTGRNDSGRFGRKRGYPLYLAYEGANFAEGVYRGEAFAYSRFLRNEQRFKYGEPQRVLSDDGDDEWDGNNSSGTVVLPRPSRWLSQELLDGDIFQHVRVHNAKENVTSGLFLDVWRQQKQFGGFFSGSRSGRSAATPSIPPQESSPMMAFAKQQPEECLVMGPAEAHGSGGGASGSVNYQHQNQHQQQQRRKNGSKKNHKRGDFGTDNDDEDHDNDDINSAADDGGGTFHYDGRGLYSRGAETGSPSYAQYALDVSVANHFISLFNRSRGSDEDVSQQAEEKKEEVLLPTAFWLNGALLVNRRTGGCVWVCGSAARVGKTTAALHALTQLLERSASSEEHDHRRTRRDNNNNNKERTSVSPPLTLADVGVVALDRFLLCGTEPLEYSLLPAIATTTAAATALQSTEREGKEAITMGVSSTYGAESSAKNVGEAVGVNSNSGGGLSPSSSEYSSLVPPPPTPRSTLLFLGMPSLVNTAAGTFLGTLRPNPAVGRNFPFDFFFPAATTTGAQARQKALAALLRNSEGVLWEMDGKTYPLSLETEIFPEAAAAVGRERVDETTTTTTTAAAVTAHTRAESNATKPSTAAGGGSGGCVDEGNTPTSAAATADSNISCRNDNDKDDSSSSSISVSSTHDGNELMHSAGGGGGNNSNIPSPSTSCVSSHENDSAHLESLSSGVWTPGVLGALQAIVYLDWDPASLHSHHSASSHLSSNVNHNNVRGGGCVSFLLRDRPNFFVGEYRRRRQRHSHLIKSHHIIGHYNSSNNYNNNNNNNNNSSIGDGEEAVIGLTRVLLAASEDLPTVPHTNTIGSTVAGSAGGGGGGGDDDYSGNDRGLEKASVTMGEGEKTPAEKLQQQQRYGDQGEEKGNNTSNACDGNRKREDDDSRTNQPLQEGFSPLSLRSSSETTACEERDAGERRALPAATATRVYHVTGDVNFDAVTSLILKALE